MTKPGDVKSPGPPRAGDRLRRGRDRRQMLLTEVSCPR